MPKQRNKSHPRRETSDDQDEKQVMPKERNKSCPRRETSNDHDEKESVDKKIE